MHMHMHMHMHMRNMHMRMLHAHAHGCRCGYSAPYSKSTNDCARHGAFRIERALYVADSLLTLSPATLRFDNVTSLRRGTLPPTADGSSVKATVALENMNNAWVCPGGGDGCQCRCLAPCERKAPVLSLLLDAMQNS